MHAWTLSRHYEFESEVRYIYVGQVMINGLLLRVSIVVIIPQVEKDPLIKVLINPLEWIDHSRVWPKIGNVTRTCEGMGTSYINDVSYCAEIG